MVKGIIFILIFITSCLYLATLAMFLVASEYIAFNLGLLGCSLFLTLILLFKFRKEILHLVRNKTMWTALSNLLTVFLISCILGMINFLVVKNDIKVDITKNKVHTLADQSLQAINLLKAKKLKFKLFSSRNRWEQYLATLRLYQYAHGNIELEAIDIDKNPALTSLYKISEEGTLVVEVDGKNYSTVAKNELAVTNLLLKITNPNKIKLYYVTGHNEFSLYDNNAQGGDYLKEKLLSNNFELQALELNKEVPEDASALLVLNPTYDYSLAEIEKLEHYLDKGGSAFFALAPRFDGIELENLSTFFKGLGVEYRNGIVLDRLASQQGSQPSVPVITNYGRHEITKNFSGRTLFPVSAFFNILDNSKYAFYPIASSTPFPGSWGETSFAEVKEGKADYAEGVDSKGPLNLFVAGVFSDSRILLSSSISFISNQFQAQSNNFNLFLNALSWAAKQEALISLNRPRLKGNIVYISGIHQSLILYFAILVFPFCFFIAAIFIYRKRLSK